MNVGDLIARLKNENPSTRVLLARDSEGTSYSILDDASSQLFDPVMDEPTEGNSGCLSVVLWPR